MHLLSFFTGGGFLDIGFLRADFDIVWTNEVNESFADIYAGGMASWDTCRKSGQTEISNRNNICDISAKTIKKEAFGGISPELFGIIGGPPCPDFSNGGTHAGGLGQNGFLTSVFIDKICDIQPDFFLFENVYGLYRFQKHRQFLFEQIKKLYQDKYVLDYTILNALDFGVPQNRERFFMIGIKKNVLSRILTCSIRNTAMAGWFPWPKPKYPNAKKVFLWPKQIEFGATPDCPTSLPMELTVWHAINQASFLPNGADYFKPRSQKFFKIDEGSVSGRSFKRLHRYRFSPTVWYGNQEVHLHPWEARRISVREAMRLQTIPDWYTIPEHICLSAKFKVVSNGVPCLLGYQVAKSLRDFILAYHQT